MKENKIKIGVLLILLVGTTLSIYINPENWLPPTLFLILSIGGLIDSVNKKNFKIIILIIVLILIVIYNKLDLFDALLLFI